MNAAPIKRRLHRVDGWKMTAEQRGLYWRLWDAACHAQGWHRLSASEREQKRHEVLLDCGFSSARHVDRTDGFDRVKNKLLLLSDAVINEPSDAGLRRRLVAVVNRRLSELRQAGYADGAVQTILKQRFGLTPGISTIDDLPTPELRNLAITRGSRLASFKRGEHGTEISGATPLNGSFNELSDESEGLF